MKYLALIHNEFLKFAIDPDWWKKLTPQQQNDYLKTHRKTKLRQTVRPLSEVSDQMKYILRSLPKNWRKQSILDGAGSNSEAIQLSDMIRPRMLKESFDDADVALIVGFESGGPITSKKPAFYIRRTYRDDKFNCRVPVLDDKNKMIIEPDGKMKDTYLYKIKERYSHRRGSYTDREPDIRMSTIVEKLPDKPYTVFAIKVDPKRQELRQIRSSSDRRDKVRAVENKIITRTAKPIYDYYTDMINENIDKVRNFSIPTFNDVLNDKVSSGATVEAFSLIQNAQSKIRSLSSAVGYVKWNHLPSVDDKLFVVERPEYSKEKIHKFFEKVNEIKQQFAEEYKMAIKSKSREIGKNLLNGNFDDAIDIIKDLDLKKVMPTVLDLKKSIDEGQLQLDSESYKTKVVEMMTQN